MFFFVQIRRRFVTGFTKRGGSTVKQSTLQALSNRELLFQIRLLARSEHRTTLKILLHLNEVERRRLHLDLGYSSLFDYCTRYLKYSPSAAGRRIQTARCIRRHPEVYNLLLHNDVNLSTVSLVAPVLTEANKDELLRSICKKSQREVEKIVSKHRPPVLLRDRVQPVRGWRIIGEESGFFDGRDPKEALDALMERIDREDRTRMSSYSRSGSDSSQIEDKLLVQFVASEAFMKKYEEVRSLLSQRLSDTSFEKVFEALINEFLERHSPAERKNRREKRQEARRQADKERGRGAPSSARNETKPATRSRRIAAAVRDEVFVRDNGRCTYVGGDGQRCDSTQALQVDHKTPFARGGPNTASNLRLLCAKHNRLAAEKCYGTEFMSRFTPRE
jgi:5-methylcytosine-specific restriction endonuclease McrA